MENRCLNNAIEGKPDLMLIRLFARNVFHFVSEIRQNLALRNDTATNEYNLTKLHKGYYDQFWFVSEQLEKIQKSWLIMLFF